MSNIADLLGPQIPRLRRYARTLTKDLSRSEDLLQSCLLRALEKGNLWEPGTDLRAWLFTILHNQHVNEIRRQVRENAVVPIDAVAANLSAVASTEAALELQETEQAIADLPRDQREVIILAGHEGQCYEEMSKRLGVPVGTIRSRLSRGRTRLRQLIGGDDAQRWRRSCRRQAA
jgi:RNA polymerase sigma-70 factor, ECF subfamily